MIINDKEIVTIFYEVYKRYFYNKDISIENVNLIIGDAMKLYVQLTYKNVHTSVDVLSDIRVTDKYILLRPKGIVRYGLLQFDILSLLKEHPSDYFIVKEGNLYIANHFIKKLNYQSGNIELVFKQS